MPLWIQNRSVHGLSCHSLLNRKRKQNGMVQTKGKLFDSARACPRTVLNDPTIPLVGLLYVFNAGRAGTECDCVPARRSDMAGRGQVAVNLRRDIEALLNDINSTRGTAIPRGV